MLSNTIVKLLAVFLFATPAVLIGGELYSILQPGVTLWDGFLKIYSVLYIIPGAYCSGLQSRGAVLRDGLCYWPHASVGWVLPCLYCQSWQEAGRHFAEASFCSTTWKTSCAAHAAS